MELPVRRATRVPLVQWDRKVRRVPRELMVLPDRLAPREFKVCQDRGQSASSHTAIFRWANSRTDRLPNPKAAFLNLA